jgi:SnoaL-like domain
VREDGKWKLAAVHHYPRMISDYDRGWARDAQPAPGASPTFPPDRRPSGAFASFPARQSVAMHFANPVTGRVPRPSRIAAAGAAQSDLVQLEQQVRAAIAVDAVENLNSSYGYYIDESAWDEMADTFGSSGAKEITGAGVYVGTERIRSILKLRGPAGGRSANFYTIHQLTQPVIHVSADGLTARARLRLFQAGGNADGSSGSWIGGIYENTALFENGEWKFGTQDLHHLFNASYRNGWARVGPGAITLAGREPSPRDQRGGGITQGLGGARSGPRLVDEMPPDRPIRARQYAFPEITEPAFHYANPVSGRRPADLLP